MEEEIEAAAQADAAEATSDMAATIKEKYEAGQELTDDELDFVADAAIRSIKDILSYFGETGSSIDEYDGDNGELILDINGGDLAVLIGRHGRTLDALQMVVSSLLSSTLGFHYPIVVDIEGYKSRRKNKVQSLARSAAARAKKQHGSVSLPPMNAYERRLVHLALVDDDSVVTHSEGEEPMRHVVVTLVNK
ncbi:MAG: R3H domain-containing nucleic acid-binding protein [Atopobiaceae bacterium]|nr:R3H domain-containing nucleic acid-binding protein [Atopobiaceae bacterium]